MADDRPNILLLMTDQQRGDALGLAGHPVLQTPHLDWIGAAGLHFRRAYSACPVCIPARRTLMTGRTPAGHGVLMNHAAPLPFPTLPGVLKQAGYQTHLCGKLHLHPHRARHGFDSMDWADSPASKSTWGSNDYQRHLHRAGITFPYASDAHGSGSNDWITRAWHLPEEHHFTNWCVNNALEFLDRRDPTVPFFLKVSVIHPHQPLTPPREYLERYLAMDLPEPVVGDWARCFDQPQRGLYPSNTWRISVDPPIMRQIRAAYYASVNHISDQFARILAQIPRNTVVVFCSDHGEMLGDHQWLRKRTPWEPSAHIPLLMKFPEPLGVPQQRAIDHPVELMDLMPTLLAAAGCAIPDTVQGQNLLPLLRGERDDWRPWVHGECSDVPTLPGGMQYLTDGKTKYVWLPARGEEQFFDLQADPQEMHNRAGDADCQPAVQTWRQRLVAQLTGRPEGFVQDGKLAQLAGSTTACLLDQ